MPDSEFIFPFGAPLKPCPPHAPKSSKLFVLGAYPSALHVRWDPPKPYDRIQALAVDNEPTPFWNGDGEEELISAWMKEVNWRDTWGGISPAGRFNGSSGHWVDVNILNKFDVNRDNTWITDCLDTYHLSSGVTGRLEDTYKAARKELDLSDWHLPPHPSEDRIVSYAVADHAQRLRSEVEQASPEIIVTLGNAALRVLKELFNTNISITKLSSVSAKYGQSFEVRLTGKIAKWYPLAHPAAPATYQVAHEKWMP